MVFETREQFNKYTTPDTFSRIVEFGTLNEMWESSVKNYSDDLAISDKETEFSFAELDDRVCRFRGVLSTYGISRGERVGLAAGNSTDFAKAFLAAVTMGIVVLILPPYLDPQALYGCIRKYSLAALIFDESSREWVLSVSGTIKAIDITLSEAPVPAVSDILPEDPCVMMFTGGTTGGSKCALLSHGAVMQGVVNGCYGYRDVFKQRYFLVLPLYHVFGLIRNLLTSIYTGSEIFICRNNKDMFRDIAFFQPTILVVVPALLEMAYGLSQQFGANMLGESVKVVICGAAHVPAYLVREYAKTGVSVFPGYGLTETANLVSGNPESLAKPDSVGIIYPHQEIEIRSGEICIRGKNLLTAYIGEEEPAFTDGWFHTGDLGYIDGEGFLYVTGRKKEIIVLPNGENISPAELEARFETCPLIQASQVFEAASEGGQHFLALEVVPRVSELKKQNLTDEAKAIQEAMKEINLSLPSSQRVSKIIVREKDFDRSPSMKIVRYKDVVERN